MVRDVVALRRRTGERDAPRRWPVPPLLRVGEAGDLAAGVPVADVARDGAVRAARAVVELVRVGAHSRSRGEVRRRRVQERGGLSAPPGNAANEGAGLSNPKSASDANGTGPSSANPGGPPGGKENSTTSWPSGRSHRFQGFGDDEPTASTRTSNAVASPASTRAATQCVPGRAAETRSVADPSSKSAAVATRYPPSSRLGGAPARSERDLRTHARAAERRSVGGLPGGVRRRVDPRRSFASIGAADDPDEIAAAALRQRHDRVLSLAVDVEPEIRGARPRRGDRRGATGPRSGLTSRRAIRTRAPRTRRRRGTVPVAASHAPRPPHVAFLPGQRIEEETLAVSSYRASRRRRRSLCTATYHASESESESERVGSRRRRGWKPLDVREGGDDARVDLRDDFRPRGAAFSAFDVGREPRLGVRVVVGGFEIVDAPARGGVEGAGAHRRDRVAFEKHAGVRLQERRVRHRHLQRAPPRGTSTR